MKSDLFFDNAKNNSKVGVDSWFDTLSKFINSFGGIILLFALIVFLIISIFQFNTNYKKHIWCWILQWICFILVLLVYVMYIISAIMPTSWIATNSMLLNSPVDIVAYLSLPILLLLVMKLQQNMQKTLK